MAAKGRLPYVMAVQRGDRTHLYYRRSGRTQPLPGPEGSDAFLAAYDAIHGALDAVIPAPRMPHTVSAAVASYRASADFGQLAASSRRDYAYYLTEIDARLGSLSIDIVDTRFVTRLRDDLQCKPFYWNKLRSIAKLLWHRYGLLHPTLRLGDPWGPVGRLPEPPSDQNRPWPRDILVAVMRAATPEFRAFLVCSLLSSQRVSDVCQWGPEHYSEAEKVLAFRQQKTGTPIKLRVPQAMADVFTAIKNRAPGRLLCTPRGRAWTADNPKETLEGLLKHLQLPRYVMHGLRATGPTVLVQLGWPSRSVMALTGHTSESEFNRYIRGLDKAALSAPAAEALAAHYAEDLMSARDPGANQKRFSGVTGRASKTPKGTPRDA